MPENLIDVADGPPLLTPLLILALLTLPWLLSNVAPALRPNRSLAARFGLALVFIFTGIGHFITPGPMAEMIPPLVPFRLEIIYITGVFELSLAMLLLPRRTSRAAGWIVLAMLAAFLPFNIYAATNRIPMGGHEWGPFYLLVRVPLQLILAAWCWWFVIRRPANVQP